MLKTFSPGLQVIMFILLVIFSAMMGNALLGLALAVTVSQDTLMQIDITDPRLVIALNLFSQVFSFLVAFLLYLRLSGERFSDMVHMQSIKLKPLLFTVGLLIVCFYAFPLFEFINEPLRQILPVEILESEILTDQRHDALFIQSDPIQFVFALIVMALLPAIFEELVFRGFLIKKMLQSGMSEYGAILMSSAIFALVHMQPMKFLAMFTLGAALGFVYMRFRNLKYAMVLHFLFNGTQITMTFLAGSGLPYLDF
ncbi:MAG: CPBP family intramembrane metalloprotease [Crocinitomix sp.]|nr:CPBP family intramembrane metalloprotease [Crocinitomix sp.]